MAGRAKSHLIGVSLGFFVCCHRTISQAQRTPDFSTWPCDAHRFAQGLPPHCLGLLVKQKEQHRIVIGRIGKTERGGIAQPRCHRGTVQKSAHSWSQSDGRVGRERLRPLTTRVILRFAPDDTLLPPRR